MEDSTGAFLSEAPTRLWLPGLGAADPAVRRVAKAVNEYDDALRLARHEVTGDWVVTIGDQGHPVFGFGRELPDPYKVSELLGKCDIKRNGKRILDAVARAAERQRLDDQYRVDEADEATADAMAHFYSKHGARKATRIFVP